MKISAVIVTRGDRDISETIDSLDPIRGGDFDEVIIWDNSKTPKDLKVFGRFAGAFAARNDLIYVQDDDCLVLTKDLISNYNTRFNGKALPVLCNVPEDRLADYQGTGITLIGWGTLFQKKYMAVFEEYFKHFPMDDLFLRECDRVFSYLNRKYVIHISVPMRQLPYAYGDDRMGKEACHGGDLRAIRQRLTAISRSEGI